MLNLAAKGGFFILRVDETSGKIDFDPNFKARPRRGLVARPLPGYITLQREDWPHGPTGHAWGHAALFWRDAP